MQGPYFSRNQWGIQSSWFTEVKTSSLIYDVVVINTGIAAAMCCSSRPTSIMIAIDAYHSKVVGKRFEDRLVPLTVVIK